MAEVTPAMRWIKENDFDPRYPFWTRANVSEVLPDPPSPLGWDLVWEGAAVAGWYDLFIKRCGMGTDELSEWRCEAIAIFSGYAYLGASLFRVWAGRTPGMTASAIDDAYFGDHPDVPPYVPEPWHVRADTTEVMAGYMAWAAGDMDQSELEADRLQSLEIQANRPDHAAMTDSELGIKSTEGFSTDINFSFYYRVLPTKIGFATLRIINKICVTISIIGITIACKIS